jgi:hypothetical protein
VLGIALSRAFAGFNHVHEGDDTILSDKVFSKRVVLQSGEQREGCALYAGQVFIGQQIVENTVDGDVLIRGYLPGLDGGDG